MDYDSPEAAQEAFYEAFARTDLKAMMAVWAASSQIACIHPMGQILRSREAVLEGWRQIFDGAQPMHFEIEQQQVHRLGDLSVHTVIENIYLAGDSAPRPPILATNIYQATQDGWRMILHHASPSVIDARRSQSSEGASVH